MDWKVAYLRAAGIKPTQRALDFLAKWQPWEGGHTNNDATFNYLNTSEVMPGSHSMNSSGIQAYKSLAQGAQAFAKTLNGNAGYAPLLAYLRGENVDPSPGLQTWVTGSSMGNPAYAARVMGGSAAASVPSVQSPTDNFTPLTQPGVGQDALKQYAVSGLGEIARGESPTSVFADTSKFISSQMQQASPTGSAATMPNFAPSRTSSFKPSADGGGFLPTGSHYTQERADQGRDLLTNPGGAIIAPGAGEVVRLGYDPNGFGTAYPIIHFTSGPYAGQDMYIGHTLGVVRPGEKFKAGTVLSHTGATGNEQWNGNASRPGWAEIGFAPNGTPGAFGQRTPFA